MIYLDYNATAPLREEVLEEMLPYLTEHFFNPSANYYSAKNIRKAIEEAREKVASLISAKPDEIIFTSGGTESTNLSLKSLARFVGRKNSRILTSEIEHSAVLKPLEAMEKVGFEVHRLPVDSQSLLVHGAWNEQLDQTKKGFASLMWANNETGAIQPILDFAKDVKETGWACHCDAVQAVGKVSVSTKDVPVDFLTFSAHKMGGPKGAGALFVREGLQLEPLLRGGGQEKGKRSGTENIAAIIGFGKAAELAQKELEENAKRITAIRDNFEKALSLELQGVSIHANKTKRTPNVSHISIDGCEGAGMVILLDKFGVLCSTGSACMAGSQQSSHVSQAMGLSEKEAKEALRFSFGHNNTMSEVQNAVKEIKQAAQKLRSVQGTSSGPVLIYPPS